MKQFKKDEAQRVIDIRNGNFTLLSYHGMRNKCLVRCRICQSEFTVVPDSLLRNKTSEHFGCPTCGKNVIKNKLLSNDLIYIESMGNGISKVQCNNCNSVITNRTSILTNPKYICKHCRELDKSIKIIDNPTLYKKSTVERAKFLVGLNSLIMSDSLNWYYCLGFFMADGNFNATNNRVKMSLSIKDEDSIKSIANIIGCKYHKNADFVWIDFCSSDVRSIMKKYKISNIKTYDPPDLTGIDGEKLIAFIVGFIDGDGSIGYRSDSNSNFITIKVHSSWRENLQYLAQKIYRYFDVDNVPKVIDVKYDDGRIYSSITFGNQKVLYGLYDFIENNRIPAMRRKWERLERG